ncbi:MAG: hypothetical protein QNJ47_18280 [Nostocaceae cyanobacterium]|nr:hypothetical protein [Nostocaceae cyanobacterium]
MQHLHQLLAVENSELAQLLKFSLCGLKAALEQAQKDFPQDPGVQICNQVVQDIQTLLQPPVQPPPPSRETNQSQNPVLPPKPDDSGEDIPPMTSPANISIHPTPTSELKLNPLKSDFNSDPELTRYLGDSPLQSQTDPDLWNEIQRQLLRVPEQMADFWRQKALNCAEKVGAKEDKSNLVQLPFIRNQDIYPGLAGSIQTTGLCFSTQAPLEPEFYQQNISEDLRLLASLVSICKKFIHIEPNLHHALKTVNRFDVISLHSNSEQRIKYIEALINRFQRTLKAEENGNILLILHAWIDIDEAINSLVFVPPAERYSWWGNLKQKSRRIILQKVRQRAKEAGCDVQIRQLSGLYADVHSLSKEDLPMKVGGIPGEVLACLRLYARINQEEFPGRVLYRLSA